MDQLAHRLGDAVVLDLYCGTGTLGLEALSRGAGQCCFAEKDRAVVQRLRRNIDTLGVADRCVVWQGDVTARLAGWLNALDAAVDVAFVDPPYADSRRWDWPRVEQALFTPLAERLAGDGIVALRTPAGLALPEVFERLHVRRTRRYSDMVVSLLEPTT